MCGVIAFSARVLSASSSYRSYFDEIHDCFIVAEKRLIGVYVSESVGLEIPGSQLSLPRPGELRLDETTKRPKMNSPAIVRSPPHRILLSETGWAIRESVLRATDILGPGGVMVKTVIPALAKGVAEISHSGWEQQQECFFPARHLERVGTLVEDFAKTDALEILARTEQIANKPPVEALDKTQEILNGISERWTNLLRDLFRVYTDALTELLCDWASLGSRPPSGIVTIRGLVDDVRSYHPEALSEVFRAKLSPIAVETSIPESRLIERFSLCRMKWLEAVARKTSMFPGLKEDDEDEADESPADNLVDEDDDGVEIVRNSSLCRTHEQLR